MGEFRHDVFRWLASAARNKPQVIQPRPPAPDGMDEAALALSEAFKDELFRLAMLRASAFIKGTHQEEKALETQRFAVVDIQLLIDTESLAGHTNAFDAADPLGFLHLRKTAGGPDGPNAKEIPSIRVSPEWYDDQETQDQIEIIKNMRLPCKPKSGG
jgi:hypothetical protein